MVVVVVVVVLTVKLMTCLWRYVITDAPNYGGLVPVDTKPGPAPVCRALKLTPSAHQRDDELPQTKKTVGARQSSPRRHK